MDEGQRWSSKIAGLAPLVMNTVAATAIPEWFSGNGALLPASVYGSGFTHSVTAITPTLAEVIGQNLAKMPADPGTMFSVHQLRGASATPQKPSSSVFASREPHFMLEILGYAAEEKQQEEAEQWALHIAHSVEEADPGSVLQTPYVSLYNTAQAKSPTDVLEKAYGPHATLVRDLKTKFDPNNVFSLAVPVLK